MRTTGGSGTEHFEYKRDGVRARPLEERERLIVLPPLVPERRFPGVIALDPTAAGGAHAAPCTKVLSDAFERWHAPVLYFVVEGVEGGLIQLGPFVPVRSRCAVR